MKYGIKLPKTQAKLTKEQKDALSEYVYAVQQEDRYLGSVFVNPVGQRDIEAKTAAAYKRCKDIGMDYRHGL